MMQKVYFPGDAVINLVPHWADKTHNKLIPLNHVGTIIESDFGNDPVTVEWEMPEQDYTVRTERPKSSIDLM